MIDIRPYREDDEQALIRLWESCGLLRPWNDPIKDIARKQRVDPERFLVATFDGQHGQLVGSIMIGYDGHRGWINYLAVAPDMRRKGVGSQLMMRAEEILTEVSCPKINLQVRSSNQEAIDFYLSLGYAADDVISLGKRLELD